MDAVWAVVEFINIKMSERRGRGEDRVGSQLEGICGSLGVDHGPKLLLLCIIGCS